MRKTSSGANERRPRELTACTTATVARSVHVRGPYRRARAASSRALMILRRAGRGRSCFGEEESASSPDV